MLFNLIVMILKEVYWLNQIRWFNLLIQLLQMSKKFPFLNTIVNHNRNFIVTHCLIIVSIGYETIMAKCTFFEGPAPFHETNEYLYLDVANDSCFVLMEFDRPFPYINSSLYIASRLETDPCNFISQFSIKSM